MGSCGATRHPPTRISVLVTVLATACGGRVDASEPSSDCESLAEAARRAKACDPRLAELAESVLAEPDEHRCRIAVRGLLAGPSSVEPGVRSLLESPPSPDVTPLRDDELEALASLVHPASVVLTSDLPPEPGIPPTSASLDGLALDADGSGRLWADVAPGLRSLEIRHAGEQTTYCIELRPCETLAVTAHGAKLARHPDVMPGPCRSTR